MKKSAVLLLALGLTQMAGDVFHSPLLKGLGAASAASPAPKVFCAVRGYEAYATRCYLEWDGASGQTHSLRLTPELYGRLSGPYNRRNVYGAALAYGPVLASDPWTRPMLEAVQAYALCDESRLLRELGVDASQAVGSVRVRCAPLPGTNMGDLPQVLEAPCR